VNTKWILRVVVLSAVLLGGIHFAALDDPVLAPDRRAVLDNYYLMDPVLAAKLFFSSGSTAEHVQERYEPVEGISLSIGRSLWGEDPAGFRVVSLLLHLVATTLLFLLLTRFGVGALWAAMGALLFAVHPLHTQAVEMLSSRGHLLSLAFTLGAALAFAGPVLRAAEGTGIARPKASWVALLLFALGLFSGLEGLFFIPFCLLLPVFLGVKFPDRWFYAGVIGIFVVYVALALALIGARALGVRESLWAAAVALKGMALVLVPVGQMIYHPIEYVGSWVDDRALAGLGLVLALAAVAFALRRRARALSLGVGFTACALVVFFFDGVRDGVLREPGLYILVAGVCAVVASLAEMLSRVRGERPIVIALLVTLVAAGSVRSWQRCTVWASPEDVWSEVLNAYPGNPRAVTELASHYREAGLTEKASALVSPEANDAISQAMKLNNEGVAMRDAGRLYASASKFREAIKLWPDFRDAHFNLGVVYYNMKMPDSAAANFERAIKDDPTYAEARYNLGIVYDSIGDYERAESEYREALLLDPNHAKALANLGVERARAGDFQEAVALLGRAVQIDPGFLEARFNLALAYESVDVKKAKEQWRAYLGLARRRGVDPKIISQAEQRLQNLR
jgi:tetratricopeptide (TPR) repeat protein